MTDAEPRGQEYVDVTTQVQAFLSIDHRFVEERAQTVLDGATGEFKQQYATELDSLKKSAQAQQSTAEATVLEVGISEIDASAATVLVVATPT